MFTHYKLMILLSILMGSLLFTQNLPHNLTENEKSRLSEIGLNRTITDPPDSIIYVPAEFDSIAGILFAWEAYTTLLTQLIKEVAEDDTAWVVVDNTSEQNSVYNTLNNANVNMNHVVFEVASTNSIWIRDYGIRAANRDTKESYSNHSRRKGPNRLCTNRYRKDSRLCTSNPR